MTKKNEEPMGDTTKRLLSRFDVPPKPSASATWWALSAGALASDLMRTGGVCRIETEGPLWDVTLEDGRTFLGCRPWGRCVPGHAPEGGLLLVASAVGEFSLVTGAKVTEARLVTRTAEAGGTLPAEGSEEP